MKRLRQLLTPIAKKKYRALRLTLLLVGLIVIVQVTHQLDFPSLLQPLENLIFALEFPYYQWIEQHQPAHPLLLFPIAFVGGLIASLSPCILALLPANLSYIGTRQVSSCWEALQKAGAFVLGVVTVLSLLGLFSSLAGLLMFSYRGYIELLVGLLIVVVGLDLLKLVHLPVPQTPWHLPGVGPYSVGVTFALTSSPCTSPVLIAILLSAGTTGSFVYNILAMVSYALGYTSIIFLTSLFTGLVKAAKLLKLHVHRIEQLGGVILVGWGIYYCSHGLSWLRALSSGE